MALLNAAYALVSRGRHVLIIDVDLEAPGLSGFLDKNGELDSPDPAGGPVGDVLSLLTRVNQASKQIDVPPITAFSRRVKEEKLASLEPKLGKLGRLDVVPANQGRDYLDRLLKLNLPALDLIELSTKLWSYLKHQRFKFQPLGLEDDPPEDTSYDYILIDSRTGMTDIGGLCVGPLADRLVVVCGLNDQNIRGTGDFLEMVGIAAKKRSSDDSAWDDADSAILKDATATDGKRGLGPKPTLVVASPMPMGETDLKEVRLKALADALGEVSVTLSYHPLMACLETLFVRDYRREYLAREYDELTLHLMAQAGDHPAQLTPDPQAPPTAETLAKVLRLASADANLGRFALAQQIDAFDLGRRDDESFTLARRAYAALARAFADSSTALGAVLNNWGTALSEQAKTKEGDVADRLRALAAEKYEAAKKQAH